MQRVTIVRQLIGVSGIYGACNIGTNRYGVSCLTSKFGVTVTRGKGHLRTDRGGGAENAPLVWARLAGGSVWGDSANGVCGVGMRKSGSSKIVSQME